MVSLEQSVVVVFASSTASTHVPSLSPRPFTFVFTHTHTHTHTFLLPFLPQQTPVLAPSPPPKKTPGAVGLAGLRQALPAAGGGQPRLHRRRDRGRHERDDLAARTDAGRNHTKEPMISTNQPTPHTKPLNHPPTPLTTYNANQPLTTHHAPLRPAPCWTSWGGGRGSGTSTWSGR